MNMPAGNMEISRASQLSGGLHPIFMLCNYFNYNNN